MPELLSRISLKFNKEIDNLIKNLATAIEPIVIMAV
jgi:type II secretory pathway component PulF